MFALTNKGEIIKTRNPILNNNS